MSNEKIKNFDSFFSASSQTAVHAQIKGIVSVLERYQNDQLSPDLQINSAIERLGLEKKYPLLMCMLAWTSWLDENPCGCLLRGQLSMKRSELSQSSIEKLLLKIAFDTPNTSSQTEKGALDVVFALETAIIFAHFNEDLNLALFTHQSPEEHFFHGFYAEKLCNSDFFHELLLRTYQSTPSKRLDKLVLFVFLWEVRTFEKEKRKDRLQNLLEIFIGKEIICADLIALKNFFELPGAFKLQREILEVIAGHLLQVLGKYQRTEKCKKPSSEQQIRELIFDNILSIPDNAYLEIYLRK